MSDLSLPPLNFSNSDFLPQTGGRTPLREKGTWPVPPFAAYATQGRLNEAEPCELEGMTGASTRGRLASFEPELNVAKIQVVAGRAPMPLRFQQFRSLTLTSPLRPVAPLPNDPHGQMLSQRPQIEYRLQMADGQTRTGMTVGHVESVEGLYLFPPADEAGAVLRLFLPRHVYRKADIGPRIGEILVQQMSISAAEVEQVAAEQEKLRSQKVGEILVNRQIVNPEQLVEAIAQQARMPMMRIGEALVGLGMITEAQLNEALEQQKSDRSTPLGQLLVRRGLVSPQDLQMALARKMGYPVVDAVNFPVEADAVRRLPFPVADKLNVLPLLLRDNRLIVAMEDPTARSSIEEIEFVGQCKVLPVLANGSSIARALVPGYEKYGLDTTGRRVNAQATLYNL